MKIHKRMSIISMLVSVTVLMLTGCDSSGSRTIIYTVGGTVSGLTGTVVLQNNVKDDLTIPSNGAFTFSTAIADGSVYNVAVETQPSGQTCDVVNGSGTISGTNVSNVTVTCSNTAPLSISNVKATNITTSSATITWITDENSTSQVEYGTSASYGNFTTINSTLSTSHSVTISNLTASTTYYYRVRSKDAANNEAVSTGRSFATTEFAGNYWYIRVGATGNNDGSDWTNAFQSLPATLIRGDMYYIAAGNYSSYTVGDPVNGSDLVTIKKATVDDHGCVSNCGWNDSYAAGQTVFSAPFNIITSYVVFDGVVGSLDGNPDDYGFRIAVPTNCSTNNINLIGIPPQGYASLTVSNITISHVAMLHCGAAYNTFQSTVYSFSAGASNITLSHNYLKDASTNLVIRRWSNSVIEYNYFAGNWSSAVSHGQQISPGMTSHDIIMRNNIFKDSTTFVVGVHQDNNYRWDIYNNIIIGGHMSGGFVNTDISSQTVPSIRRWRVYENTFVDARFDGGGYGVMTVGPLDDEANDRSYFYNNLFYNSYRPTLDNTGYGTGALVHSHNAYFNTTGTFDNSEGGTAQVGSGDPFVGSANGNYHLAQGVAAIDTGISLPGEFSIDYDGVTRPQGAAWDIGAYEYH